MATAKKKSTAKRPAKSNVKYAAKTASAAQTAARSGGEWVKNSSAQWQKGAADWAKQSAELYALPFSQDDASRVAKNATEGMMNFAQQVFDQSQKNAQSFGAAEMFKNAPQFGAFNPQQTQEKLAQFASESAAQFGKSAGSAQHALAELLAVARENAQTCAEVSNLAVSVSKELGAECINYLNKSFSQNVEFGKQVHSCRTLNDLFDLASQMTKANLDSFFSESIRFSEKLFRCATDVSEPLNERVSETNERLVKALSV